MSLSAITLVDWLTMGAIVIGPIAAVLISLFLQRQTIKQNYKFNLIATVLQNRHSVLAEDHVRALNAIDLVFAEHKEVRQLWEQFMHMRNTQGISPDDVVKKYNQLIEAMVRAAGYGKSVSYIDMSRVFYPNTQQPQPDPKAQELVDLMIKVFRHIDSRIKNDQRSFEEILSGLLEDSKEQPDD